MLSGGASPLYAASAASREQDCLLFTGYQDCESVGAALLNARQGDRLLVGDRLVSLNCQVTRYSLSGHADAEQIVHVVTKVNPRQLILVHGASASLEALARRFPKITVDIPAVGSTITCGFRSGITSLAVNTNSPREEDSQLVSPPTLDALWAVAVNFGPARPWTSVELGQSYYGAAYRPAFRLEVEQVLKEASPHFKIGRMGAQPTYFPRGALEVQQLRPLAALSAGDLVLVGGQNNQGPPQIAFLLSSPSEGRVSIIADKWKAGLHPINVIQLVPGFKKAAWLDMSTEAIKQSLQEWRRQMGQEWVDLFFWWKKAGGRPFTFSALCAGLPADEQKLALGLEFLVHGRELFRREGVFWRPLEQEFVLRNEIFRHHLELLNAGAGAEVRMNERQGFLTGRSTWRHFEVNWSLPGSIGETTRVRVPILTIGKGRQPKAEAVGIL
jgi:hypothetical protein